MPPADDCSQESAICHALALDLGKQVTPVPAVFTRSSPRPRVGSLTAPTLTPALSRSAHTRAGLRAGRETRRGAEAGAWRRSPARMLYAYLGHAAATSRSVRTVVTRAATQSSLRRFALVVSRFKFDTCRSCVAHPERHEHVVLDPPRPRGRRYGSPRGSLGRGCAELGLLHRSAEPR
jgi:hypothetical protein